MSDKQKRLDSLFRQIVDHINEISKRNIPIEFKIKEFDTIMASIMPEDIKFQYKVFEIIERHVKYDKTNPDIDDFYCQYQAYFFNRV